MKAVVGRFGALGSFSFMDLLPFFLPARSLESRVSEQVVNAFPRNMETKDVISFKKTS
jgi:hypothetical protein